MQWSKSLRDKLHGPLHRVTCCAMVKIVARQVARTIAPCNMLCNGQNHCRQVAPIVAQSRIGFYFLQRLQQFFSALHRVTPFQQLVSQCFHNNDCERTRVIQCSSFYRKKCTNALQRGTPLTLQLQRHTNHHCETSCMKNCTV